MKPPKKTRSSRSKKARLDSLDLSDSVRKKNSEPKIQYAEDELLRCYNCGGSDGTRGKKGDTFACESCKELPLMMDVPMNHVDEYYDMRERGQTGEELVQESRAQFEAQDRR